MSSQTMRRLFNSSWPLAIFLASAECFQRTSGESCSPAFQADSADFYDPMRGQVCSFLAEVLLRWNDVELALCAMAWCQRGPHRESLRYWRGHAPLLHRAAPRCTALHRAAPRCTCHDADKFFLVLHLEEVGHSPASHSSLVVHPAPTGSCTTWAILARCAS